MRDYVILTDSCCDLSAEMAAELGVEILPLRLQMGERAYRNYLDGREIGFHEFYERVRSGELATTSAVSVGEFEAAMRPILAQGKDILYIGFSSALSTTYQSAVIAADDLRKPYGLWVDRRADGYSVYVTDSWDNGEDAQGRDILPPLTELDKRVRHAANLCVDRTSMKQLLNGQMEPATGMFEPGHPWRGKQATIPTLQAVLQQWPHTFFYIDIKSPDADPTVMGERLLAVLKATHSLNRVRVYSTEDRYIAALPPAIPRFVTRSETRTRLANVTFHQQQIDQLLYVLGTMFVLSDPHSVTDNGAFGSGICVSQFGDLCLT